MNDDKLSSLIQKIGHTIDDIRDRSMIMLIQKYEKGIISETDFKKRNYFFDIILRYINDRNSSIPLKALTHVLDFVRCIIEKDQEVKNKFEQFGIYTFTKEFLTHFRDNEDRYKKNSAAKKLNVPPDADNCLVNYEHMQVQNSNNEYSQVVKILIHLIRAYNGDNPDDFSKWDTQECAPKLDVNNSPDGLSNTNGGNKNGESESAEVNGKADAGETPQYKNNATEKTSDMMDLNKEEGQYKATRKKSSSVEEPTSINPRLGQHSPEEVKENTKKNTEVSQNNADGALSQKDLLNISQIMKKNNCINIFTKNNFSKSDDFKYYNSLYEAKNEVNKRSIHLLLTYKIHKSNKIREGHAYLNHGPVPTRGDTHTYYNCDESHYAHILRNYTFFYLYNFFDCFDVFRRNFLEINGVEQAEEAVEVEKAVEVEDVEDVEEAKRAKRGDPAKSGAGKRQHGRSKEGEDTLLAYFTHLHNKHVYNKNITYKIKNYIHKTNLLHFYLSMKFNYFECLGMNIIKKVISIDDLVYMHKEVNKILNEYIYIFNKDIFLFNYKFVYTLSYNIHYIYKNYVENNQAENEFHHMNNLLNSLAYLIFIIIYSLYVSVTQRGGCLCNSIHNIYLNNFFFLINQNVFYLLLLPRGGKGRNSLGQNQPGTEFKYGHNRDKLVSDVVGGPPQSANNASKKNETNRKKNNTDDLNRINTFYLRKNEERAIRNAGDNTAAIFNEGDTYYYLFITKNNCVYFFKVLIFFMLEILKISHCKISSLQKKCTTLNFHIDNFVLIYNFLCNILECYFGDSRKQKDSHLEILIDYIEENNLYGRGDKKEKQNGVPVREYLSENLSIHELNSFSSSSSNSSSDLKKNKFQSIDMFTNTSLRRTYQYSPKQLELLKIVCLYINYTPVSFILMKKIQPKLVDLFRRFLFDLHLNTHHIELLHFFKIFFFFYDYEVYKEYTDLLSYLHCLANLFFVYRGVGGVSGVGDAGHVGHVGLPSCFGGAAFRSDIPTFINASNNISHFFFFIPTSYSALNGFLEKYHAANAAADLPAPHANEMFSSPADANDEPFLNPLETFKSQDFFDAPNSEKMSKTIDAHSRHESAASHCIRQFCHLLLQTGGGFKKGQCKKEPLINSLRQNKMDSFTLREPPPASGAQGDFPHFDAHFIDGVTQVLVENSLRMLFNSLSLLSSEYSNFTNYVKANKQEKGSMYQFTVNKLKSCKNKMYILTLNHNSEGRTNVPGNAKFVELFKNFVLLLHNIISIMYSYNTEIIFFFFNFIFNINYEKGSFDWENKDPKGEPQGGYSVGNYNYQIGWGKQTVDLSYGELDHNTISEKRMERGNVSKNAHMENSTHSQNDLMSQNNHHGVSCSNGGSNQPEHPKAYQDTQYVTPIFAQRTDHHRKNEQENHFGEEKGNHLLGKNTSQEYPFKNVGQLDQREPTKWEASQTVNSKLDRNNQLYLNSCSNNDVPGRSTLHGGKAKSKSPDLYTPTFQVSEFVDVIYELCVYSKKEIRNYYLFFILENVKKKVETLFDSLKEKERTEKKTLLSNIKLFSKVLLFLYYSKKKYILVLEQAAYSSFGFLYDHHFEPILAGGNGDSGNGDSGNHSGDVPRGRGGKRETEEEALASLAYFYKNVFLNVHSLYFLLFQRKKKKRTLALKIMWKLHHQFRLKFTKWWGSTKKDASPSGTMKRGEMQSGVGARQYDICEESETAWKSKEDPVRSHRNEPTPKAPHHQNKCHNTFSYSNDWKFNTNMLNIYISHFILNHMLSDEEVITQALRKVDMKTEELPLDFFDHVMSFILKRKAKFRAGDTSVENTTESKTQRGDQPHMDHFLLSIYEKIKFLYTKLIGEMLAKEQTSTYKIESFVYVLKIIILLIITNYRNSSICKRIYKERYFYLSHLFCFFFYDNEIVKALSISLSFYLIFDQNVLLLNKHRIFLEPHLLIEQKSRKGEMGSERDDCSPNWLAEETNSPHHSCTNMLENSLINEVKAEYMEGYYKEGRKNAIKICGDGDGTPHWENPPKDDNSFFNPHKNRHNRKDSSRSKHVDKEMQPNQVDDVNKASFHIERKILFFLPFWLYKKLQPNNFLLNVKKLKSFFFFSTKYSYLHAFHDAKLNLKAKGLSFHGNYDGANIFRSYFLFINKYYHLSKRVSSAPVGSAPIGSAPVGSAPHPPTHRSSNPSAWSIIEPSDKLANPQLPIANANSFLFLNAKVDTKHTSPNGSSYVSNLIKVLKVLPPINDSADNETNFSYIYNLSELFFYLNNCYMQLLCTEGGHAHSAEGQSACNQASCTTGDKSAKRDDVQAASLSSKSTPNGSTQKDSGANSKARTVPNKQTHYLLQSDYDEIVSAIHFVYTTIFPYINKLLFFMYNQLTISKKEEAEPNGVKNQTSASAIIHSNMLLLKHLVSLFDVCLYIQLILEKKKNMEGKIQPLDKDIDLSLFIYKLLFISVATSSLKNKISSFSLNVLYNFVHLDDYYVRIKNNCHGGLSSVNRMGSTNHTVRVNHLDESNFNLMDEGGENPMLLKEQRRIRSKQMERRKNLSILVNFLFFLLSKYRKKKKIKKGEAAQTNADSNIYSNIINVYEVEKTINVENVTFQNHEQGYLKMDIYFVKNVMSMLHVVLRRGCFFDLHLVNEDISRISIDLLMRHDWEAFTQGRGAHKTGLEENPDDDNTTHQRSDTQKTQNSNVGIPPKGRTNLRVFKQVFLNKYMSTLVNFCNMYNDIIIECLHVQLLLLFFKYILQVFKYEIWKKHLFKNSHSSKQHILVHFLKYYKADKEVCKFLKRIYFVILKYAIYMQNVRICEEVLIPFNGGEKDADTTSEDPHNGLINKHNYLLKEEDIYKNYCQLFYQYTISKFKNCVVTDQEEAHTHPSDHYDEDDSIKGKIYKYQQSQVANPNYVCMIEMYCPQCEETKILFLSIVLFLSFFLDNFPFFFCLNGSVSHSGEANSQKNTTKDNMAILCERIFHYLGRKNIYTNFYILKEAKLFEKYFFKIFLKLLFCDERETMNNLQKYKIYFYNRKGEAVQQGGKTGKKTTNMRTSGVAENQSIALTHSGEKTEKDSAGKNGGKQMDRFISNEEGRTHHLREEGSPIFTQNISHDNHFYLSHFLNYFLLQKKKKNDLELIYDKIYYYILIVSMCFKDRNFLALLLSQNENFFPEFNQMIQHYLKYVLKNKQELTRKKKKNEVMIHNLLYIFVSYIYIYLNELYNIFFTQIKNVLTLPSFFQNIIYVDGKEVGLNGGKIISTPIKAENASVDVDALYNTLINMKKKNWNKNLENYTDQNIKNVVVRNIFHNNNIYLFILYIINDNKYNDKGEGGIRDEKKLLNRMASSAYEENHQSDNPEHVHLEFKKNDKIFLNKVTTNIVLFFLLFFYDYYSFNYEIKENILMQIARHILEHFATFYNSDLLNIHLKYAQMVKTANLKRKKTQLPGQSLCRTNRFLKNPAGGSSSQETSTQREGKEGKMCSSYQKNVKGSRASMALARIREEGRRKRGEPQKGGAKMGEQKHGEDSHDRNAYNQDANNNVSHNNVSHNNVSHNNVSHNNVSHNNVSHNNVSHNNVSHNNVSHNNVSHNNVSQSEDAHDKHSRCAETGPPGEDPPRGTKGKRGEPGQAPQPDMQLISAVMEKLKRNKKLLFLYTINCFRIIQTYSNVSSLIFKYKYVSTLLEKLPYLTDKNVVESVWNSFHFYLNSNNKSEINISNERGIPQVDKEIGYLSYMYINYFFNFLACFILYDVATLYKFCSNGLNCLDMLNSHLKELMENKKGTYLCSVILKFYLTITNTYFFDFSLYDNAISTVNQERAASRTPEMDPPQEDITTHLIDSLRRKKRQDKGEVTYFMCVKKLSNEFSRSKFLHFLINYVMNNLGNNVNKSKVETEQSSHLICLILQLLSYQIIFIDNKNELLKLSNVLIKYIKKKDPCLLTTYYIIVFFNSCFINSSSDERIITLLFTFEKNDNLWFNLIFLQNSKIKRSKEILLLIKFSILHLYLLLLKNKSSFKKCILCISGDLNIYFVFIYVLNEIYEFFKSCNFEWSAFRRTKINQHENNKNENPKRDKHNKYYYLYAELLVIVTEMIKIMNNNDVNKYITIYHNKEKDNLVVQFKNLYRKIKNELKQFEQSIKLVKYLIFIHPLMINMHVLHRFYLCLYIKEYHYFHKEFFKYDLFLVDYLHLLRGKRKAKISNMGAAQRGMEAKQTGEVSSEAVQNQARQLSHDGITKKDNELASPHALVNDAQKGINFEKDHMHFYFFFNTPKNYNYQVNNLCSSILQNEFQGSLSKFFSSSFSNQGDHSDTPLQYNAEQIKMYADYIHGSVNYAIEFFSSF